MKNNNMLVTVLLLIIVGGAAFFGGMKYQANKTMATAGTGAAGAGANGQFGAGRQGFAGGQRTGTRGGFGGATVGTVVSIDADSITLKLQDGSSKIVNLASTTTFSKTDTAAKTDVKTGDTIAAIGSANTDGSITAQNIQLNPMFRNGNAKPGMGTSPTPTK